MLRPCKIDSRLFWIGIFFYRLPHKIYSFFHLSLFPQSEVAEQRSLAETYRAQLLSLEAEMDTLREVSAASKEMLKVI